MAQPLSTCATRRRMRSLSLLSPRLLSAATSSVARSAGPSRRTSCSFSETTRARCSARPARVLLPHRQSKMTQGDFSELYDPSERDDAGNISGQLYDPFSRVIQDGKVVSATPFAGKHHPAQPVGCGRASR